MRYNAQNTAAIGKPKRVFIDGKEIENVVECDTDEGFVKIHLFDESGNAILDGDCIATDTLHGKVTVKTKLL